MSIRAPACRAQTLPPAGTRSPARAAARRSPASSAIISPSSSGSASRSFTGCRRRTPPISARRRAAASAVRDPVGREARAHQGAQAADLHASRHDADQAHGLVIDDGTITKVFYPVFPPDKNAGRGRRLASGVEISAAPRRTPRGTSPASARRCWCCSASSDSCENSASAPIACAAAMAERRAPSACRRAPSPCSHARCGRARRWRAGSAFPRSSASRKSRQVLISAGVGLFSGGTQRTALVMRQSTSSSPSSGRASIVAARKAEARQRGVEQVAGIIAGERPAGAVGASQPGARPTIRSRASSGPKEGTGALNQAGSRSRQSLRNADEPRTERAVAARLGGLPAMPAIVRTRSSDQSSKSSSAPAPARCGAARRCRNCGVCCALAARLARLARLARRRARTDRGRSCGCSSTMSSEDVGLAAQFVGDHRRLRRDGRDHGDAHAAALHRFDQRAEIAVAGEQHHVVDVRRRAPWHRPRARCPCCL